MLWLGRCGRHLVGAQTASGHRAWLSTGKGQGSHEDTGRFRAIICNSHQQLPANAVLRVEIVGARELLSQSSMWGLGSINPSVHMRMGQRDVDKGMWTEASTTQLEAKSNPVMPPKKEFFRSIASYWMRERLAGKFCVSLSPSPSPSPSPSSFPFIYLYLSLIHIYTNIRTHSNNSP